MYFTLLSFFFESIGFSNVWRILHFEWRACAFRELLIKSFNQPFRSLSVQHSFCAKLRWKCMCNIHSTVIVFNFNAIVHKIYGVVHSWFASNFLIDSFDGSARQWIYFLYSVSARSINLPLSHFYKYVLIKTLFDNTKNTNTYSKFLLPHQSSCRWFHRHKFV